MELIETAIFPATFALDPGPRAHNLSRMTCSSHFCLPVALLITLAAIPICRAMSPACGGTNELALYVSPSGDDAWTGRLAEPNAGRTDGPLATIQKARDALRQSRSSIQGPANIILRTGIYTQEKTLVFTPADSGTAKCPITYGAYPGERPVISGGRAITGWRRDEVARKARGGVDIWRADIPPLATGPWRFNQLFVNGERRIRARMPNKGSFLRSEGPVSKEDSRAFYFKEGDVQQWPDIAGAIFVVYHSWETSIHHVRSLDMDARRVAFVEPAPWPMAHWEKRQRYYVENVLGGLDEPGEWYLDDAAATAYYCPLPGEDPAHAEIIAPVLTSTLVSFTGQASKQVIVEYIRFRGLTFAHSNANLKRVRNPGQGEIYQPALIQANALRHSIFEDCEIAHTGAHGIWFAAGCENNVIRKCHLHDLGGGGVYMGGGWGVHDGSATRAITVDNNYIHDGSHLFHGAHGVWIGTSSSNSVTHNEISNFDYSGISCGWSWGFQPSSANNNALDYNHIHHLGNGDGLSDMGGIYTLGVSPGTTERGNHIHDVYNYAPVSHGSGIYPDEGSSDILIKNNVVYRVRNSPLFQHYGTNNLVRNNVLAFGGEAQLRRCREDKPCHYMAMANIICAETNQMLGGVWKNGDWYLASNLYWCTTGQPKFKELDFPAWQSKGKDIGSIVADPLFVDAAAGDFTLRPNSPASRIGFRPIDIGKAGLYGDRDWTDLPRRYPDRALNDVRPPAEPPFVINFDFEAEDAGKGPIDGEVILAPDQAVIVSTNVAAGGSQSLRFSDAPGHPHTWTPHLYYRPSCVEGEFNLSWDMWNDPKTPCQFNLEARQWDCDPYLVGPSISVGPDGRVRSGKHEIGVIRPGRWAHVDIRFRLGPDASKTWHVTLTSAGDPPATATIPYPNNNFRKITWFGISSTGNGPGTFYLDNLRLGTAEQLAHPPERRRVVRRPPTAAPQPKAPLMLAGSWDFEGIRGYTATDDSGCGNHGEIWASFAQGKFGNAIYCESATSHVNVPDAPSLHLGTADFSIALWICPTQLAIASPDQRRRFMSKHAANTWWNLNVTADGRPFIEMRDSNGAVAAPRPNGTIPQNEWTHLAVVVDRTNRNIQYYLNGALDSSRAIPATFNGSLDVTGGDLTLGSQWQPFIGLLDGVRIFRRALDAAEIREACSAGRVRHESADYQITD